jgi:hypothetical protein
MVTTRLWLIGLVAVVAWSPIGGLALWMSVRLVERAGLSLRSPRRHYVYRTAFLTILIASLVGLGVVTVVCEQLLAAKCSPTAVGLVALALGSLSLATAVHGEIPTPFWKACVVTLATLLLVGSAASVLGAALWVATAR